MHIEGNWNSENLAVSGAEQPNTTAEGNRWRPGIDFSGGQADMLRDFAKDHEVKLTAVSIGGNDNVDRFGDPHHLPNDLRKLGDLSVAITAPRVAHEVPVESPTFLVILVALAAQNPILTYYLQDRIYPE